MLRQVSFLDYPQLVGTAKFGVALTPGEIAERTNTVLEMSFDDLGVYEFLALQGAHGVVGFRRHKNSSRKYSYASCILADDCDAKSVIAELCGIGSSEVVEFNENW
jgi:hypothetical protein